MNFHDGSLFKTNETIPTSNIEDLILNEVLRVKTNLIKTNNLEKIEYVMPLVIDTQTDLLSSINNYKKYLLCINQEMICDPGSKISCNKSDKYLIYIETSNQLFKYFNRKTRLRMLLRPLIS